MAPTDAEDDFTARASRKPPARRATGTTYPRGVAARKRILETAYRAFAERGFRGASMNEIAKASGLTMAGLIHHYPSKSALLVAVLEAREAEEIVSFRSRLPKELTAFDTLDAFVVWAGRNAKRPRFVQLNHLIAAESASGDHPGTESAASHYRTAREILIDGFERSIQAGEIRSDQSPEVLALWVVGMIEGLENQWLHEPRSIDLVATFGAWVEEFKAQLRPPPVSAAGEGNRAEQ